MGYAYLVQNPDTTVEGTDRIGRIMQTQMREAQKELKSFQTNFATNPLYAFEWSGATVKAAAMHTLLLRLANDMDAGRFMDADQQLVDAIELRRYLDAELRRNIGGSPGYHSTWVAYAEALVTLREKIAD